MTKIYKTFQEWKLDQYDLWGSENFVADQAWKAAIESKQAEIEELNSIFDALTEQSEKNAEYFNFELKRLSKIIRELEQEIKDQKETPQCYCCRC